MLETIDVGTQDLKLYERSAAAEAVAQLQNLAAPLVGARVLHVNATPYGGGNWSTCTEAKVTTSAPSLAANRSTLPRSIYWGDELQMITFCLGFVL
jgi:hypothetical protein